MLLPDYTGNFRVDGRGDGSQYGNVNGSGYGSGKSQSDGDNYGDGDIYGNGIGSGHGGMETNHIKSLRENPYVTRLIDGDNILFIACQQVMLS